MPEQFDVVVLGGGGGAEALVRALAGSGRRVAVVEEHRVGGECPFTACMPSKVMLHESAAGTSWEDAVRRRQRVTEELDDAGHARDLADAGATLVRGRGRLDGPGRVVVSTADGERELTGEHVVLATGATERWLDVPGLVDDAVWTSHDVWTLTRRPRSVVVVGAGAVGLEVATCLARFGVETHLVDRNEQLLHTLPAPLGQLLGERLAALGVVVHHGAELERVERLDGDRVTARLSDGTSPTVERVVVAVGKLPRTEGIGLETLGLDPMGLEVGADGRVAGAERLWAVGDVTAHPMFTHAGNALGEVVGPNLLDGGDREVDFDHTPRCVFTDPPVAQVGVLPDDDEHVTVTATYDEIARPVTDRTKPGVAALTARRSDGELVGVAGVGAALDEVSAAWAVARANRMTAAALADVMQQFPTHGEITRLLAQRARAALG